MSLPGDAGVYDPRIAWREGFESIDAATLLDKPLPKSKFLVDGLIPQAQPRSVKAG